MAEPPKVTLREVAESDLETFFEQQLDPEAARMAAFPSRDHDSFLSHWRTSVLPNPTNSPRTVLADGRVAGYVTSWEQDGRRLVAYWIGRSFWGRGIATAALAAFVEVERTRPSTPSSSRTTWARSGCSRRAASRGRARTRARPPSTAGSRSCCTSFGPDRLPVIARVGAKDAEARPLAQPFQVSRARLRGVSLGSCVSGEPREGAEPRRLSRFDALEFVGPERSRACRVGPFPPVRRSGRRSLRRCSRGPAGLASAGRPPRTGRGHVSNAIGESEVEGHQTPAFAPAQLDELLVRRALQALLLNGGGVVTSRSQPLGHAGGAEVLVELDPQPVPSARMPRMLLALLLA